MKIRNIWLIAILFFDFLDVLTTYIILEDGGIERNEVAALTMRKYGVVTGLLLITVFHKMIAAFAIWLAMAFLPSWQFARFLKKRWLKKKKAGTVFVRLLMKFLPSWRVTKWLKEGWLKTGERFPFGYIRFLVHFTYAGAYLVLLARLYAVINNSYQIAIG